MILTHFDHVVAFHFSSFFLSFHRACQIDFVAEAILHFFLKFLFRLKNFNKLTIASSFLYNRYAVFESNNRQTPLKRRIQPIFRQKATIRLRLVSNFQKSICACLIIISYFLSFSSSILFSSSSFILSSSCFNFSSSI